MFKKIKRLMQIKEEQLKLEKMNYVVLSSILLELGALCDKLLSTEERAELESLLRSTSKDTEECLF